MLLTRHSEKRLRVASHQVSGAVFAPQKMAISDKH